MTLRLRVDSLSALTETLSGKGQHCFGAVGSNDVGKWAIQFYPHGDARAKDGSCSVFIKNMVLRRGIAAVKIEGNVRIVAHAGSSSAAAANNNKAPGNGTATGPVLHAGSAGVNEGVIPSSPSSSASASASTSGSTTTPRPDTATTVIGSSSSSAASGAAAGEAASGSSSGSSSSEHGSPNPPPPPSARSPTTDGEEEEDEEGGGEAAATDGGGNSSPATATATATARESSAGSLGGSSSSGSSSVAGGGSSSSSSSSAADAADGTGNGGSEGVGGGSGAGVLLMTKAFGKSAAFLSPTADGVASSSSWGFHDFCPLSDLPESFVIEAEIQAKDTAREDALALHVHSLADLKRQCPRGQSTLGSVHVDAEGAKWSLCLYPNGDNLSREGQLGVFVKVLSLPRGVTAVKIEGNLRVLQQGRILASRSFPVSTFLNASGTGAASSSTWGFHDFCELREVGQQDAFVLEADITIRDRAREPSVQEVPEGYSVERLLDCLRLAHAREVEDARNSRRPLSEAQLRTLSVDQLLEMQEHVTNIIKEKRSQENECAVCQDRVKTVAFVPCGHRVCAECSPKIAACPECRQPVTQKVRLF